MLYLDNAVAWTDTVHCACDGRELARQLRGVIGETQNTITYQNLIGADFTDEMRAVEHKHLIDAEYLGDTKRVEMNQGRLEVL